MRIPMMLIALILLLVMVSTVAFAAERVRGYAKADTRDKFKQLVVLIQQEMGSEGRYRFVSATDRVVVERRFADMLAIFDQTESVDAMDLDQKTALFNAQEKINGILTQNDRDRIVCQDKKIIGSHIPRRTCATYGELKEEELATQDYVFDSGVVPCYQRRAMEGEIARPKVGIPCAQ